MMRLLNNFSKLILSFAISINIISVNAEETIKVAEIPSVTSKAYMLLDLNAGHTLAASNENDRIYPASTTKILTAILAIEHGNLQEEVTITQELLYSIPMGSSHAAIVADEVLTVESLIYCAMLPSGNEAATALALHVGGDIETFSQMMNDLARKVGAFSSNFTNPTGLHDDNHYTTANDMSKITEYALQNDFFKTVVNTAQKKLPATNKQEERVIFTSNQLTLRKTDPNYYEYATGVKTGYTDPAGTCLVSSATNGDESLLLLLFGGELDDETYQNSVFPDSKALLEWGFDNFETKKLLDSLKPMFEVTANLTSESDYISLKPSEDVYGLVPIDFDETKVEIIETLPESVDAPIKANQVIGSVEVTYDGVSYGKTELVALNDLERSTVLYVVDQIENFFQSTGFLIALGTCASIFGVLLLIRQRNINIRRRRRMKNRRKY